MVARQSVGSRYTEPLFVLLGFGAVGAVALTAYTAAQGELHPNLVAVVAVAVCLFLLRWWLVSRGRRWILPTEVGFILEDRHGTRSFTYDEILDLAMGSTIRYNGGVPRGTVCRGTIVTEDCRVPFHYEFPLDQPDPLGFFFDRVLNCLIERAEADLAAGNAVPGERWELTETGLTFRTGRGERYVDAEDIAAAGVVGDHVCVWTQGESRASIRILVGSTNALVLLRLLNARITARGIDPDDAIGGLGRVMFERGKSANPFALLAVTLMFAAAFAGMGALADDSIKGAALGLVVFAVVGSPVFLAVLLTAGNVFRCHALGVHSRFCWRSRELRYEDVGQFTYAATRSYYNGIYVGTSVRMRFTPRAGVGGRTVTFSASIKDGDADLDTLREHVSRVIAGQMRRRLEQGECPKWTDGLRFCPDGIEWTTPGGLFSRRVTRLIPYDEIAGTDIQEGHFYLFLRGVRKAVYTTPVSAENFFPGLALLEMVRYRPPVVQPNHPSEL